MAICLLCYLSTDNNKGTIIVEGGGIKMLYIFFSSQGGRGIKSFEKF